MAYEQLQTLLLSAGKKQADLARLIKKTPAVITNLFGGERKLDAQEAQLIANWLGVDVDRVIGGPGARLKVPVVGSIARGGIVQPLNDAPLAPQNPEEMERAYARCDLIDAPPGNYPDGLLALRVDGDDLKPFMLPGSIVYYAPRFLGGTPDECLEKLCVAQARDGTTYIKTVRKGMSHGRFYLHSYNGDTIADVELVWCARVVFVKPA